MGYQPISCGLAARGAFELQVFRALCKLLLHLLGNSGTWDVLTQGEWRGGWEQLSPRWLDLGAQFVQTLVDPEAEHGTRTQGRL